ncbi:hypothetical protein Pedsa_0884 [Pseudopedobacter saltans DSM 12145]|uniref:Uncharacterized protein n=1 Tax=Pseudopedobacter saltans (strain ATCC 51119 / DSM 12145 / JCM 21818 / CCUG 39354 / LMG 10337 / NBRC 100064 / NCIMB 13643) TaxID=762903 RepID=F0SA79_PSESL|nr:hypothetical protein [Pseudopedobacter saltans]ADY51456.1 hypothetical protein Pedsa_0884 [Pseudopedobacter saltans DSM 12145]
MAKQAKTNKQEAETVNLDDILSREIKVDVPPVVLIQNDPQVEEVVFDDEVIEHETVQAENTTQQHYQAPDSDYQEAEQVFMSNEDLAENIVNLLDGLQSSVIPYLREKKIFSDRELELLQKIDKNAVYDSNTKEFAVLEKWKRHQEVIKSIPFDEGESRRLKVATANYAATTNMKVTPLQGLIMAYSEVVIKRIPVFMSE